MGNKSEEFNKLSKDLGLVVPNSNVVVHKTECLYSIDNEYSPDGIYVNLLTFESFGKEMLKYDRKYPKALYLNIKKYLNPLPLEDKKEETVDEGEIIFKEKKYFEEVSEYEVFSPELGVLKLEEAQGDLLNVCNSIIGHSGYEFKNEDLSWANIIEESKYAKDLYQVENPPKVSHNNLKCQKCGSTTNLWLNLSDGYIGCGRKHYEGGGCQDGSEGAALLHYQETGCKYHLVVKLGTITPTSADVYSYSPDEDNLVSDPLLDKHLSHFGIKVQLLKKTEKSTLQIELEKNQSHDWSDVLTENGTDTAVPLSQYFVGILNSGNNCYLNSVIQFMNVVKDLNKYFVYYYNNFSDLNTNDILLQYSKICTCINTNKFVEKCRLNLEKYKEKCRELNIEYFNVTTHNSFSVNPNLFKYSLSKFNKMFDNCEQQDAEEFLSLFVDYLCQTIKQDSSNGLTVDGGDSDIDVKSLFYFNVYQVVKCDELKLVNVNDNETHILSLPLLNALRNKEMKNNKERDDKEENKEKNDYEVDPDIKLELKDCLESWLEEEVIEYFKDGKVYEACLVNRLVSLPKYLFVKMERFYVKKDWTASKLVNGVGVPNEFTFELYDKKELEKYGEEYQIVYNNKEDEFYEVDEGLINTLLSMGFTEYQIRRSYFATKSKNVDECLNWILSNDLNDISESLLLLKQLGYENESLNVKLLGYYGDDMSSLIDYLSTRPVENKNNSENGQSVSQENLNNNNNNDNNKVKFKLLGFITHIGSNTNSGHYVCHLKKEGEWYTFNDTRIHKCQKPPHEYGYIYLFEKCN